MYLKLQGGKTFFTKVLNENCGDRYFNEDIARSYQSALTDMFECASTMLSFWWISFAAD